MKYIKQNITEVETGLIMHGVNCLHKMGSGVALAIRKKWPDVYDIYMRMPSGREMLGQTHMICVKDRMIGGPEGLYIANCYTQLNYGYDGVKYADIDAVGACVRECFAFADANGFDINTPRIASDRGGLDWTTEVEPIFIVLNTEYPDVNVNVYYI